MNILNNTVTVDSYHQYFLPEYNGVEMFIVCKRSHLVLAKISPQGHLEVFKGYKFDKSIPIAEDALLVRHVLTQFYNKHHGRDFYSRKDIDIIFCNVMKQFGEKYIYRKCCYFGSVCYSMWEKFLKKY